MYYPYTIETEEGIKPSTVGVAIRWSNHQHLCLIAHRVGVEPTKLMSYSFGDCLAHPCPPVCIEEG